MSALQVRGEESDLENTVVLEKGPKHVGLVPRPPLVDPLLRIFEGVEHVVEVNEHSAGEPWQNPEEDMIDVAVHLGDVRRVDEEDVPGSERLEALERYLLEAGRHNLDPLLVAGLEEREKEGRVRFDE